MSDRQPGAALLSACARFELGDDVAEVRRTAAAIREWMPVVQAAEDHGIAPLLRRHLRVAGVEMPADVARQLSTLAVRHRRAHEVRTVVLLEALDGLARAGVEAIVLKGAALAHVLYPSPELRPMRDLDLLVRRGSGRPAQLVLQELGFDAPLLSPATRPDHHHLPIASIGRDGFRVSIEIHEDVLSPDQRTRAGAATLREAPAAITIDGRACWTLGPTDMLRHLCAHLLEPCDDVRLINVVDFVEYAARQPAAVDSDTVSEPGRRVANALSLMHYIVPLPQALSHLRPSVRARPPDGVGRGMPALSAARARSSGIAQMTRALLYPSEWWMRANYAVQPGRSLTPARWGPHTLYLFRAIWRRRSSGEA